MTPPLFAVFFIHRKSYDCINDTAVVRCLIANEFRIRNIDRTIGTAEYNAAAIGCDIRFRFRFAAVYAVFAYDIYGRLAVIEYAAVLRRIAAYNRILKGYHTVCVH